MRYTFGLILVCLTMVLQAQKVKNLIGKDSARATLTIINNNAENSKRASFAVGFLFAQFQYFKCNKFVVDIMANVYGGLHADYYHCFKSKTKSKPETVYLGKSYEGSKTIIYYAEDSIRVTKMRCLHSGLYMPSVFGFYTGGGTHFALASPGIRLGYGKFRVMVNKYKTKAHEFNLKVERTFRKGLNFDFLYFPVFNYHVKQIGNFPELQVSKKNVVGAMLCFHGTAIRAYDKEHQTGVSWRIGAGGLSSNNFMVDFGLGFAF